MGIMTIEGSSRCEGAFHKRKSLHGTAAASLEPRQLRDKLHPVWSQVCYTSAFFNEGVGYVAPLNATHHDHP